MYEQTCRDILEEYFEGNFELLSFIERYTWSFCINFNCTISNEYEVNRFVDFYTKEETSETIKLKYKKKDKHRSIFHIKAT